MVRVFSSYRLRADRCRTGGARDGRNERGEDGESDQAHLCLRHGRVVRRGGVRIVLGVGKARDAAEFNLLFARVEPPEGGL
jgi:hypothetical protein